MEGGCHTASFDDKDRALEALLSEYRALYGLAELRLLALDRRIPLVGGVLTGFLASVPVLPAMSQVLALIAIPVSLIWLVRTTINHARSFEDALRRLEEVEARINGLVGEPVVGFQSTHPSRGMAVGGRTGAETVGAVVLAACLLLGMCLWMGVTTLQFEQVTQVGYAVGIAGIAGLLIPAVWQWREYRYQVRR